LDLQLCRPSSRGSSSWRGIWPQPIDPFNRGRPTQHPRPAALTLPTWQRPIRIKCNPPIVKFMRLSDVRKMPICVPIAMYDDLHIPCFHRRIFGYNRLARTWETRFLAAWRLVQIVVLL
jgi:hypothetical protein